MQNNKIVFSRGLVILCYHNPSAYGTNGMASKNTHHILSECWQDKIPLAIRQRLVPHLAWIFIKHFRRLPYRTLQISWKCYTKSYITLRVIPSTTNIKSNISVWKIRIKKCAFLRTTYSSGFPSNMHQRVALRQLLIEHKCSSSAAFAPSSDICALSFMFKDLHNSVVDSFTYSSE